MTDILSQDTYFLIALSGFAVAVVCALAVAGIMAGLIVGNMTDNIL